MKTDPKEVARERGLVMLAFADGQKIEVRYKVSPIPDFPSATEWEACTNPNWDWIEYEYRVAPKRRPDLPVTDPVRLDQMWEENNYLRELDRARGFG